MCAHVVCFYTQNCVRQAKGNALACVYSLFLSLSRSRSLFHFSHRHWHAHHNFMEKTEKRAKRNTCSAASNAIQNQASGKDSYTSLMAHWWSAYRTYFVQHVHRKWREREGKERTRAMFVYYEKNHAIHIFIILTMRSTPQHRNVLNNHQPISTKLNNSTLFSCMFMPTGFSQHFIVANATFFFLCLQRINSLFLHRWIHLAY